MDVVRGAASRESKLPALSLLDQPESLRQKPGLANETSMFFVVIFVGASCCEPIRPTTEPTTEAWTDERGLDVLCRDRCRRSRSHTPRTTTALTTESTAKSSEARPQDHPRWLDRCLRSEGDAKLGSDKDNDKEHRSTRAGSSGIVSIVVHARKRRRGRAATLEGVSVCISPDST